MHNMVQYTSCTCAFKLMLCILWCMSELSVLILPEESHFGQLRFYQHGTCSIRLPELSIRVGGQGFPPATMNVAPGCFCRKIEEK